ncbi:MAG: hypothetical protein JNK77_10880 [Saprospiraceae bacterium]|nr:hypothetical protein [Saprospiraceae bacterium]
MRNALFLFVLLVSCLPATSQNYFVVSVKDSVMVDGHLLQKKDKIESDAKIHFSSKEAFAYVMSPGKGYYILSPKKMKSRVAREFVLSLKEALLPPDDFYATSVRTFSEEEGFSFPTVYEMQAFFRGKVLLIGEAAFKLPPDAFVLDEAHYFSFELELPDGVIIKRGPVKDGNLIVSDSLRYIGGHVLDPAVIKAVRLLYRDQTTGVAQQIGVFQLVCPDRQLIADELQQLYQSQPNATPNSFLHDHAMPYLQTCYGNAHPLVIASIIKGMNNP